MRNEVKQKILTIIIIVAIIAIIGIVFYAILTQVNSDINTQPTEEPKTDINESQTPENPTEEPEEKEPEEYVGKEETNNNNDNDEQISKEDKAIQLVKEEWGEDDTVTFNIEQKKEDIYYVAVKSETSVLAWYEVDTNTWEVKEY